MNASEGLRRLGILLGVSGGILGGFLAYSDAQTLWNTRKAHRRFESVMASSTMQKVAKAMAIDYDALADQARAKFPSTPEVREFTPPPVSSWQGPANPETLPADFFAKKQDRSLKTNKRGKWEKYVVPDKTDDWETIVVGDENGGRELLKANPLLKGNRDGINMVHVDPARAISSVELSTGESVHRTEPPTLLACFAPFLYPIVGFLLPWGVMKAITWVGTGFFT